MAKKLPQKQKAGGLPLWLGTFGDLMSLLLTFFILLLSMATFDAKKLAEAEASIKGALSILEGGIKIEPSFERITLPADITIPPEYAEEVRLIEQSIVDFNESPNVSKGVANITGDGISGFIITLPANVALDSNFNINEDARTFLRRIAQIAQQMPENTNVEVLVNSNFGGSNLNFNRASNSALSISRELHALNVAGGRISTIGKEDKSLQKGEEILNIRFYAKEVELEKTKGILDK